MTDTTLKFSPFVNTEGPQLQPAFVTHGVLEPILISQSTARKLIDVGTNKWFQLVKSGIIELVKVGDAKMVVYASFKKLAEPTT